MADITIKEIKEILESQHQLNLKYSGKIYLKTGYSNEREMYWTTYILNESFELLNSFNFEHWKHNTKVDKINIIVEIVDLLHFILSLSLWFDYYNSYCLFLKNNILKSKKDSWVLINEFIYLSSLLNVKFINNNKISRIEIGELISSYIELYKSFDLTTNKLFQLYHAKRILNIFRIEHGYSEGKYKKLWDGVEDNIVIFKILLSKNEKMKISEIKSIIEEEYKKLK